MSGKSNGRKRVVARLNQSSYVKLYGLKLRESSTLERLLQEAVDLLIETRRAKREATEPPAASP
jgi:hypothetical protein